MNLKKRIELVAQRIYETHGEVSASALVDACRDPECEAHDAFEWDDSKAAVEYRLWQARSWLRNITIEVEQREERLVNVRVQSTETNEGAYKPVSVVASNPVEFDAALRAASERLNSAHDALQELQDAAVRINKPARNYKRAIRSVESAQRALA